MRNDTTVSLLALLLLAGCGAEPRNQASADVDGSKLAGTWRAVLASPGGELPFLLRVTVENAVLRAVTVTGGEELPIDRVLTFDEGDGVRFSLHFSGYDSEITTDAGGDGGTLTGIWRKTVPEGDSTLAFTAHRATPETPRFLPLAESGLAAVPGAPGSIDGHWAVEFTDQDGTEPARAELHQEGSHVTGTFLTPVGDYRYLEGSYEDGVLRLSTFDGAHAFLFVARAEGSDASARGTLRGDFWSRDSYHATWTGRPVDEAETILPDAWNAVGLTNDGGRFSFAFPDLEGREVSLADERFAGKVVLVNIFGSWCPNCNDEAPLLARFDREYRDRGLAVVGLAYEFSGDADRDTEMLLRFADRHEIGYTLLLAGTSDKQKAGETLPDLTAVLSYPTTIFIDRGGRVRRIHSGFSGPATGAHHERLVAEMETLVEELLDEPAA